MSKSKKILQQIVVDWRKIWVRIKRFCEEKSYITIFNEKFSLFS